MNLLTLKPLVVLVPDHSIFEAEYKNTRKIYIHHVTLGEGQNCGHGSTELNGMARPCMLGYSMRPIAFCFKSITPFPLKVCPSVELDVIFS